MARELKGRGHRLLGIRLDSGDLAYLSKRARVQLDQAGLHHVRIIASNQLDEYVIRSLLEQDAPIDAFGVGTRLITGQDSAALDGVYKLSMCDGRPRLKFSENFTKITLPGIKRIIRFTNGEGLFYADAVASDHDELPDVIYHPFFPEKKSSLKNLTPSRLMDPVMEKGVAAGISTVQESAAYARERLELLSPEHKRFENPHVYKVGITRTVLELRSKLMKDLNHRNSTAGP
ncbi:MAG: hypothetical protein WD295_02370 [Bacteroidota bacterium]